MKTARSCGLVAILLGVTLPSRAPAQSAQSAEATALFKQGKKLADDNDYAGACEKFETSERLDPQIGTEMNLGKCHEQLGHSASAWSWYHKALERAKKTNDYRASAAKQRVAELDKRLVHLTVQVPIANRIDGLVVKLDERELERGEWDQELPVDPDTYTVTADAPGRRSWSDTVTVRSKDRAIEVPKLERARGQKKLHGRDPEADPLRNQNHGFVIAFGGFAIGTVAIATGFAIYSQSLADQADTLCPMILCKDAHAVDLNHNARLYGRIANVGWGLGASAVAAAGIAWYLGQVTVAPVVDGDRAGVVIGGRF